MTLGRVRRKAAARAEALPPLRALGEALGDLRLEAPLREEVREVSLMRSVLGPAGPQYSRLDSWPLS